jgi:hypothetical protein
MPAERRLTQREFLSELGTAIEGIPAEFRPEAIRELSPEFAPLPTTPASAPTKTLDPSLTEPDTYYVVRDDD